MIKKYPAAAWIVVFAVFFAIFATIAMFGGEAIHATRTVIFQG